MFRWSTGDQITQSRIDSIAAALKGEVAETFDPDGTFRFGSGELQVENPGDSFRYSFVGSAIAANRDITIPLLTGDDTLVTEDVAQVLSNKTLPSPTFTGDVVGVSGNNSFGNLLKAGDMESWSAGTAVAPDGWTVVGAGALIDRSTTRQRGAASARLTRVGTDCRLEQDAFEEAGNLLNQVGDRTYTFGAWVFSNTASRARLRLNDANDSTFSSYHSGSGAFEWLTVTKTMDTFASALRCALQIDTGDIDARIDGAMLVEGSFIPGYYPHPNDQHLRISNFQDRAPSDNVDQGFWRQEIGEVRFSGDTGQAELDVAITFETAFRTLRGIQITGVSELGGDQVIYSIARSTGIVSGFTARVFTRDGSNFASTDTADAFWEATGQV